VAVLRRWTAGIRYWLHIFCTRESRGGVSGAEAVNSRQSRTMCAHEDHRTVLMVSRKREATA